MASKVALKILKSNKQTNLFLALRMNRANLILTFTSVIPDVFNQGICWENRSSI